MYVSFVYKYCNWFHIVCVCVWVRNVTQFGSDSESVGPKMDACHIMIIRTEISSKNAVGDVQRPHNC